MQDLLLVLGRVDPVVFVSTGVAVGVVILASLAGAGFMFVREGWREAGMVVRKRYRGVRWQLYLIGRNTRVWRSENVRV